MKTAHAEAASGSRIHALMETCQDTESRPEPLQSQREDSGEGPFHTISFHDAKPPQMPENTCCCAAAIIPNSCSDQGIAQLQAFMSAFEAMAA